MAQKRKQVKASPKKKQTARQKEQQARSKQREKEYKKQIRRIERTIKSAEAKGYVFNKSIKNLLKKPKRITKARIEKLSLIKPKDLYLKSYKVMDGKRLRGDEARKQERRIAGQKGAKTRKENAKFLKPAKELLSKVDQSITPFDQIPQFQNPYHNGEEKSATFLGVASARLSRDLKSIEELSYSLTIMKKLGALIRDLIESKGRAFCALWYSSLNLPDPKQPFYYREIAPLLVEQIEKYLSIPTIKPKDIAQTQKEILELDITGYEDDLIEVEDYQPESSYNFASQSEQWIDDDEDYNL